MSSNTNLGNTPVNQGYVQLIHTGETGGIDGTLRTLYDGDGTASDLQIASNKVKVSTELYIGSKTATEFIQDIVGDMFTTGSYTNITTTYDDTNGNIDLSASGEVTLTGTQTLTNKTLASPTFTGTANGANLTLTGDLTVSGDTIFTNSNTVLIGDAILTLNADETGSPTANAGFEVERGTSTNKSFLWNETDDKWTIGSETFVAGTVEANLTGNVTGNVTGSASLNLLKSNNLSDLTNASTARSNLGVDAAGTDNSTDVTLVTTSHDYLSLSGQAITLGTIDIGDDTNLVGGTGITLTGDTLSTTDSEIVHDNLNGYVENEHKDHSAINITAGSGLSGGGNITASRQLALDISSLDAQTPALTLSDKVAIYDTDVSENNVATLTQLKAIVNTDTNTNQLTTFDVSGDSGTDQTISHGNTLTISGGNGISTSTSATDILSVALGGFSSLTSQSSPDEQDLVVIEEAIGGAIKKVQVGALTSGISFNGSTANGLLTYGNSTTADVESNLTFDGSNLNLAGNLKLTTNATYLYSKDASGNSPRMFGINSANNTYIGAIDAYAGGNILYGVSSNVADQIFYTSGSERLRIKATTGNVGIGGNTPQSKLMVATSAESSIPSAGADSAFFNVGNLASGTTNYGTMIGTLNTGNGYIQQQRFDGTATTYNLLLQPNGGDVGIGETSPDTLLHIKNTGSGGLTTLKLEDNARLMYLGRDAIAVKDLSNNPAQLYINSNTTFSGTVTTGGQIAINDTNAVIYRNSGDLELITYAGYDINLNPAGDVHIDGASLYIPVGERLYFGGGNHTYISEDTDDRLRFFTGGAEFMRFTEAGTDQINLYHNTYITGTMYASADVVAYNTSDKRLKDNLKPISNSLEKLQKLTGYEFDWNDKQDTYKGHDVGVVAQEVEKVLPEVVTTRDSGYKAVKYEKIVPLLIEAIKEQQQQINKLEDKLNG